MKCKRFIAAALVAVLALATVLPASASGADPVSEESVPTAAAAGTSRFTMPTFDVPAKGAVLMSRDTGEVLYAKNADERMPMASITKVMTLLLTFDALDAGKISMTDIVPVSEHSYSMGGSQIWLEPGEQFTLDEMIRAICVSSANDAAVAVAEYVGGSEPVFAEMMNKKAEELGMVNTHFVNACGLDTENHYSSAHDVAIMSREMLTKHPEITKYTTIWTDSLRGGQTQLTNTNKLLKRYAGIDGLKTGTTGGAGVCISASAVRDNLGLISVVLGCASSAERFEAATTLLDYGFANFEAASFPQINGQLTSVPVKGGCELEVPLTYAVPEKLLLKKGEGAALAATVTLPEAVEAPVQPGAQLGTVTLAVGGEKLGEYPVTAAASVPEMNFSFALDLLFHALTTL